jgi:hypothetical protein
MFKLTRGDPCAVCGTRYNTKADVIENELIHLCSFHILMTETALKLVLTCIRNNSRIEKVVFQAGRYNSYDRDTLLPHYSDELLIEHTEYTLNNCSLIHRPASTYEEALQLYAQELVVRLKKLSAKTVAQTIEQTTSL